MRPRGMEAEPMAERDGTTRGAIGSRLRKAAAAFAVFLVTIALAASAWWFRPWSEYSPAEVYAFSRVEDRAEPFRMMHLIYPYREIAAAPDHAPLPRAGRMLDPEAVLTDAGEPIALDAYAEANNATGLMVLSGGEVVLERYFNGESAADRHTSWSVAKSVVATLIGRALMEGAIASLDDSAATYAPDYAGTPYGEVSIRHLLMMSSGIDFDEDYATHGSDIRKLFFGTFFWNRDVDSIVREHGPGGPERGAAFDYISSNTAVLAAVLRGAYGGPLADIASEKLFVPIGAGGGTWLTDSQGGKEIGYCCVQITLEDYARLGRLYLDDGMAGDERIVPKGWARFVADPPTPDHEPGPGGSDEQGYGQHFWLPDGADGEFYMAGFNGQIVWIDVKRDVVVAMTGADRRWPAARPDFVAMVRALARGAKALREGTREDEPA